MPIDSPDSPTMRAFERKAADRALAQASHARQGRVTLTADDLEAQATAHAIAGVAGWENLSLGGEVVAYSSEKVKEIVSEPRLRWLRDWIEEKLRDRGNFIGAPALTPKK